MAKTKDQPVATREEQVALAREVQRTSRNVQVADDRLRSRIEDDADLITAANDYTQYSDEHADACEAYEGLNIQDPDQAPAEEPEGEDAE